MNFATFDFATFERHVFREELAKDHRKNFETIVKMAKSKTVAILVATHFHYSISSVFILFHLQMKRLLLF